MNPTMLTRPAVRATMLAQAQLNPASSTRPTPSKVMAAPGSATLYQATTA
ncbi:Uncharacterised protein [Bordetella pertussis]|nr:Uncharacterised protein [Bordetella pertussis]